jgi:F-type H+-transporting ATPase subunit delta
MKELNIVKRYGDAFAGYAKKSPGIGRCLDEARALSDIVRNSPEAMKFLFSLEITQREKSEFIDKVLGSFSEEMRILLKMLLRKGRIDKFADILEYIILVYSHEGELSGFVRCVSDPGSAAIGEIRSALERKFSKKVNLEVVHEPGIIGGLQIVIGNIMIDASVRRRLDEVREKLLTVRVH